MGQKWPLHETRNNTTFINIIFHFHWLIFVTNFINTKYSIFILTSYLNGLVGSCDESNEQRKHHVDEERDEGVQVNLAEQPHQSAALLHPCERHKHVVPVDKGEQAFWHHGQGAELRDRKQTATINLWKH